MSICRAEERPGHCPLCVKELQDHGWNRTRGRTRARSHLSVLLKNNYLQKRHFEIHDASIKKESRWKFFPSISPTAGWFDLLTFNFSFQLLMISSQVSHYLQKKLCFFFAHLQTYLTITASFNLGFPFEPFNRQRDLSAG